MPTFDFRAAVAKLAGIAAGPVDPDRPAGGLKRSISDSVFHAKRTRERIARRSRRLNIRTGGHR